MSDETAFEKGDRVDSIGVVRGTANGTPGTVDHVVGDDIYVRWDDGFGGDYDNMPYGAHELLHI